MKCPSCEASLPEESLFCLQCGHQTGKRSLKKLVWAGLGGLSLILAGLAAWLFFTSEDLVKPVQGQLQAIKNQEVIHAYYAYTSSRFQSETSLEKFKAFIKAYPLLAHHQKMVPGAERQDRSEGSLTLYLIADGRHEAEVHYQLEKEGGRWKIASIELIEYRTGKPEEPSNATAAMLSPIEQQLQALRSGDLLGAYQGLVSQQFQKQTPLENFKAFIIAHPILTQHQHYDFKEHSLDHNLGSATLLLNTEQEQVPVEYRLLNENGLWKILTLRLASQQSDEALPPTPNAAEIVPTVRQMLDLFQQGKIRTVYDDLIAKDVESEVPFETFRSFIQDYPALTKHAHVEIQPPSIEEGIGHVTADVEDERGSTILEATLTQERGVWKIIGIHVASTPEIPAPIDTAQAKPKNYKMSDLVTVIEAFLAALRAKEYEKAYNYTSKEFQYSNSQSDFNLFFTRHPEFGQSLSTRFEKEIFNHAISTFSGQLILPDNRVLPVEFDMIQEEGQWKILHIYALPVEKGSIPPPPSSFSLSKKPSLEFGPLLMGTRVDDEGHILNPKRVFKPDSGDLSIELSILNGTAGTEIEVELRHVESGSSIKPVTATLTDNGESTLTFLFSPPSKGWPRGNYQLRVSSSTHVYKTYTFTVE